MAFSWKACQKRSIRADKKRVQIYLKNGDSMKAADLKRKIERLEKIASS